MRLNWPVQDLPLKKQLEDPESKLTTQLKTPLEDQELRLKYKLQDLEDYIIPTFDLSVILFDIYQFLKSINLTLKV